MAGRRKVPIEIEVIEASSTDLPRVSRINQRNAADCAMCVTAMFCGLTWEQLLEKNPFLAYKTSSIQGGGLTKEEQLLIISSVTGRTPLLIQNYYHAEENTPRIFELIKGKRAILSSYSLNFQGCGHAVFWDGKEVIDPSNKRQYTKDTIIPYEVIL